MEFNFLFFLAFLCFAGVNFYLYFFKKVSLHQHGHDHSHSHGHDHAELDVSLHEGGDDHSHPKEDTHKHGLPEEMDRPQEVDKPHSHGHDHSHDHLHIHHEEKNSKHQHLHYQGIWGRIIDLRNFSILFILAAAVIISPWATVAAMVVVFLAGTYLSIYLLSLIYIAGGIRLMEKCISSSDLLSGFIGILVLL